MSLTPTGPATLTVTGVSGSTTQTATASLTINNPVPTLSYVDPGRVAVGSGFGGFTLIVNGSNFAGNATVQWNGSARPTSFVSGTQLEASIPATDRAVAGTAQITVFNPPPGGGVSNAVAVLIVNPPPSIFSISPAIATAGGAGLTLTVNGLDFLGASIVRWNGSDRSTSLVSGSQLQAAIAASDIAAVGTAQVTVFNPGPGGGTSNAVSLTITALAQDFSLSVSSIYGCIQVGRTRSTTVTINQIGGLNNPVALSCSGLPDGASCTFSPNPATPSSNVNLSINTLLSTPLGPRTFSESVER